MQERQKDRTRYFRELAETSERYFMPYIGRFRPIESGLRVLEIGCGDGYGAHLISSIGADVVAIDVDTNAINYAKRKYKDTNITFELYDGETIDYADHIFNMIVSLPISILGGIAIYTIIEKPLKGRKR